MNHFRICFLVAMIALLNVPAFTQADQIAPNPNPAGNTISINTSDATNNEDFKNHGTLQIGNLGTLTNLDYGAVTNYGTLNNSGTLISMNYEIGNVPFTQLLNYGTLNNISGGMVDSERMFNYNTLINYSGASMLVLWFDNSSGATITNYGKLYQILDLPLPERPTGFSNAGIIYNYGSLSYSEMHNSGTIYNTGSLNPSYLYFYLDNTGTLTNSGNFSYTGHDVYNYGILNNSGTIEARTSELEWVSSRFYNLNILDNSGTLLNDDEYGIVSNSGTLINSGILINNGIGLDLPSLLGKSGLTNNGTLINSGSLINNGFMGGGGTYIQTAGQTINNGDITQGLIAISGGSLNGTGTINSDVIIGSGASVNPGNSTGTLIINGPLNSSGDFYFDIAGLLSGEYDVLIINGSATFTGGNVQFDFINGYHASVGNYWDFLFANSISGWDTLDFSVNGLDAGVSWRILGIDGGKRFLITPLPTTIWLLAPGLLGLAAIRRKFKKHPK